MQERFGTGSKWQVIDHGHGGHLHIRSVDPEIQAQMPVSGRTFIQVGPIETFVNEVKKFLRGEPNSLG
jgi:hypothetical protein